MLALCLDFDGVLHSYTSGWQGAAVVADEPVPGAIDFLVKAVAEFDVSISSSRSHEPGGIEAMQQWLIKHGANEAIMALINFPTHKPSAFVTIDDRAITFEGRWPSIERLKAFKPWNKGGSIEGHTEDQVVDWLRLRGYTVTKGT